MYKNENDNELLYLISENNEDAKDIFYEKYIIISVMCIITWWILQNLFVKSLDDFLVDKSWVARSTNIGSSCSS